MVSVRILRSLTVATFVVLAFLSANPRGGTMGAQRIHVPDDEDQPASKLEDTFVLDIVTRFNESLVGNIDAIDTTVMAVVAGNVAVAVFAIDKIRELDHAEECWAIALLAGSLLACILGYVIGFPIGASKRDGVLPRFFVPDVVERENAAVPSAIEAVIDAGEINLSVRLWKRTLVVAAILLLLASGVVIAMARLSGNVIG